jgi:hypothetical protein
MCQWCGKLATCQTNRAQALRGIKSKRNRSKRQAEAHSNGYDQLEGEWLTYYKVASKYADRARVGDRDDLLHDIMIALADVERNNGHKPFTEVAMCRIASIAVVHYWRAQYRLTNGLDCGSCSQAQRQKCRSEWLYSECPKAIKLEYLDKPITDNEGNLTEFGELIADDEAIDLDQWLDSKTFLSGCPQRLIGIAHKIQEGQALTDKERQYLWYWRKREQKTLDLS